MSNKLFKILWSLVILFILVTALTFTFGLILVGTALTGIYGVYRYYQMTKKVRNPKVWSKAHSTTLVTGEIVDITRKASSK